MDIMPLTALPDRALIGEVKRLAAGERQATAALVASLAEFDARRLYLGEGCASLFAYCTQVLELSEHAAYHRIEAARAVRRFPAVLDRLVSGDINLTAIGLLAVHFTPDNCRALLDEASHRSKREVEVIVARIRPRADVPSSIRKVPERRREANEAGAVVARALALCRADDAIRKDDPVREDGAAREDGAVREAAAPTTVIEYRATTSPRPSAVIRPLAPARYHLQVTVSVETRDKLCEAQDLLRHVVPSGDPAVIIDRALALLVSELRRARQKEMKRRTKPPANSAASAPAARRVESSGGSTATDSSASAPQGADGSAGPRRRVPAAVARAVWQRDRAQCAFVGTEGRCRERAFLELHHRIPFADGGPSIAENLELRCRAHNQYEADLHFAESAASAAYERGSVPFAVDGVGTRSGPS
jgi:5-methylcytosine-specific restriction endonuclease McrA